MEALGYVLLYFLRGSLPWQGLKAKSSKQQLELVLKRKQSAATYGLFRDVPKEFEKYFEHVGSPRPVGKPNYAYLRRLFLSLFRRNGFEYDKVFDWTELKFLEKLEGMKGSG